MTQNHSVTGVSQFGYPTFLDIPLDDVQPVVSLDIQRPDVLTKKTISTAGPAESRWVSREKRPTEIQRLAAAPRKVQKCAALIDKPWKE